MKRHRVSVSALLAFVTFGGVNAAAEEMTAPPAIVMEGPSSSAQWTGLYIGANAGYGWSQSGVSYNPNDRAALSGTCGGGGAPHGQCIPSVDFGIRDPFAGGQVGFNWQINPIWMTGVEADYQWASFTGNGISLFRLGNVGNVNAVAVPSVNSFGTFRVRMGVVPFGPLLFYGTGGLAVGQVGETLSLASARASSLASGGFSYACGAAGSICFAGSSSAMMLGWTVGGGGELALTARLTFKAEILFIDLGVPRATLTAQAVTAGTTPASFAATFSPAEFVLVRGGLNFRF